MISNGYEQIIEDDARESGKIGQPRGKFCHVVRHQVRYGGGLYRKIALILTRWENSDWFLAGH